MDMRRRRPAETIKPTAPVIWALAPTEDRGRLIELCYAAAMEMSGPWNLDVRATLAVEMLRAVVEGRGGVA